MEKKVAAKLAKIDEHTNTQGDYYRIGTLYGFNLIVKTEESQKDKLFKVNRFFVEGEGSIKYSYNNGQIANDPKLAVNYFLHAIEKIPSLITKYEQETETLKKDVTVLQDVVNSTWRRENELKDLKTELDALDRKIQLSLKPINQNEDKQTETENNESINRKTEKDEVAENKTNAKDDDMVKKLGMIQELLDGKITPESFLKRAKEAMGDRLVIASMQKLKENKPKGMKL